MKFYDLEMTKTEAKPISLEVIDLQEGESLTSANINHTPPSGSSVTIDHTEDGNFINMVFGPFGISGYHFVVVQAVGNGSVPSKPETVYCIKVR